MMQDEIEIDLRKWIRILFKNWYWILSIALLPGVITFLISFTGKNSYSATSLVAITKPQYVLNFDPRIQTVQNFNQNYGAYQELATSDEILSNLLVNWKDRPANIRTPDNIRGVVNVSPAGDPSIISLSATLGDAKQVAELVNTWASLYSKKANEIFGGQNTDQVGFFQNELKNSQQTLENAEQAIIDFQSKNQLPILSNQLDSLLQAQNEYLARMRNIEYIAQDIRALKKGLDNHSTGEATTLTNQIAYLYLQIRAFNTQPNPTTTKNTTPSTTSGIQLQINNSNEISSMTLDQQSAFLNQLDQVIQSQSNDVNTQLEKINPDVLQLQKQIQELTIEQDRLNRTRDVAKDTYTTIAQKVDETKISTADTNGSVQIASTAIVPYEPISKHVLRNTGIGIVAGLILGVLVIIIITWWKENPKEEGELQKQRIDFNIQRT